MGRNLNQSASPPDCTVPLTRATFQTHAVVGRSKHKIWIRQLHYRDGDEIRVDKVTLTDIYNDTKNVREALNSVWRRYQYGNV